MLGKLLLLFIIVPAIELILLIQIGQVVGTLPTIALIVFTGVLGAFLAKRQGMQVLTRIRIGTQSGQIPADSIFDGAIILVAGAFLMTPGILTDSVGFLCLIPVTRQMIKNFIRAKFEKAVQSGQIFTASTVNQGNQPTDQQRYTPPDDVVIIDYDDYA